MKWQMVKEVDTRNKNISRWVLVGEDGHYIAKITGAFESDVFLMSAAPELVRFAKAIEESVDDALRPGSPDNFMSLVKRLHDYRAWARAAILAAGIRKA